MDSPAEILEVLLRQAVERGASDVHLKVPSEPLMRVHGVLERIPGLGRLTPVQAEGYLASMLAGLPHSARQLEFEARGEVDFTDRAARRRPLPGQRLPPARLDHPDPAPGALRGAAARRPRATRRGRRARRRAATAWCWSAGPPGSGVTTTIAALIDRMNDGPPRSVITIEDPIEVLHSDRACAINQREVGLDTASVADGLVRVLRHDPDVVVVGALDDPRALDVALDAAANGVLVIAAVTHGRPVGGDRAAGGDRALPAPARRPRGAGDVRARGGLPAPGGARGRAPGGAPRCGSSRARRQVRRLVLAGAGPYAAGPAPFAPDAGSTPDAIAVGSATATSR